MRATHIIDIFLGSTPLPIIFGAILDEACIVWQKSCDSSGSCWIYDNHKMGLLVFVLCLVVNVISTGSFLIAAAVYKPRPANEIKLNLSDVNIEPDIQNTDTKQMDVEKLTPPPSAC